MCEACKEEDVGIWSFVFGYTLEEGFEERDMRGGICDTVRYY